MENGCLDYLLDLFGVLILKRIDGVRLGLFIAIIAILASGIFLFGHWIFPDTGWVLLTSRIWAGVSALGLVVALFALLHK